MEISVEKMNEYSKIVIGNALEYGPKLIGGIIFLIIGLWIAKSITNGISKMMEKRNMDPSLRPFLNTLTLIVLRVLVVISVMGMIGIEMTSFIAIIGSIGLAIGLALSGTLQNFAGGVILLILKPYQVGDVLEAQGFIGVVSEIQIFHTILKTYDNKTVIIPNGQLSNNSLINYSTEPTRVVEWVWGISYDTDIDKAKNIVDKTVFSDDRIIQEDSKYINVSELADSSVNLKIRARVNGGDYWGVFFDMNERIKKAFDAEGISIPFPQIDVHMDK